MEGTAPEPEAEGGGERTIPIHPELLKRIKKYLPEAGNRYDEEPIWHQDYKSKLQCWGATWAETFMYRYDFGSHMTSGPMSSPR